METAREFHIELTELIGSADRPHQFMDVHQRQGVCRVLKIRTRIVRRPAGEALDVWEIYDGFVKLGNRYPDQRQNPTIVIAGIPSRRGGRQARAHPTVERHVVFLEWVHGEVVSRADGAE